jgi:hypothetical protein
MINWMAIQAFLASTRSLGFDIVLPNFQDGRLITRYDEPIALVMCLAEIGAGAMANLRFAASGALIHSQGVATPLPAITRDAFDTTGAGNSFAGRFLAHLLRSYGPLAAGGGGEICRKCRRLCDRCPSSTRRQAEADRPEMTGTCANVRRPASGCRPNARRDNRRYDGGNPQRHRRTKILGHDKFRCPAVEIRPTARYVADIGALEPDPGRVFQ